MELLKDLELVAVEYKDSKVDLTFLDDLNGVIRKVSFNKKSYDRETKEFVDDVEKSEKVDNWCQEYFNTTFDNLESVIGVKRDVYVYDGYCSLFETQTTNKFPEEMVGEIFNTTINEIYDDGLAIVFKYSYDDKEYQSKMSYADYVNSLKQYFVDPNKKAKKYEQFEKKFKVPFEEKDKLIGKTIMVEIKKFKQFVFGEIKPLKK